MSIERETVRVWEKTGHDFSATALAVTKTLEVLATAYARRFRVVLSLVGAAART